VKHNLLDRGNNQISVVWFVWYVWYFLVLYYFEFSIWWCMECSRGFYIRFEL